MPAALSNLGLAWARLPSRTQASLTALAIGVAAILPYVPSLGWPFVYDDHWTIEDNAALAWSLPRLARALLSGQAYALDVPDATRPAMVLLTWLERQVHGAAPAGYHATSLLLYVATIVAAWWLAFALLRRRARAHLAAALFAFAPLHAECVATIHYREDLLAGLGTLAPLALLALPAREPHGSSRAAMISVAWGLGLASKESAVALVPLVVLLAPFLGGWRWIARRERSLFGLGAVLLLWGSWRWALSLGGDPLPVSPLPLAARLIATPPYLLDGLGRSLAPLAGAPISDPERAPALGLLTLLGVAATLGVGALALYRPTRGVGLGLAFALVAPLATSPLAAPYNDRADRYLFVAIFGGAVAWAAASARLEARTPAWARGAAIGLACLGLGLLAHHEARAWESDLALWQRAVERKPRSVRAWTGLAHTQRTAGRLTDASRALDRAQALDPRFPRARLGRVYLAIEQGELEAARAALRALERDDAEATPGFERAARCLALEGSAEEVRACARRSRASSREPQGPPAGS